MRRLFALVIASVTSAVCASTDKYSGRMDHRVGYVIGTSQFQRTMADLNPVNSQYTTQRVRIRVIAPPEATQCRIADQSPFMPPGPQPEGKPNSKGEVMIAYDAFSSSAAFVCDTPAGQLTRSVTPAPWQMTFRGWQINTVQVKPPMVHVDPSDPDAAARWTSLAAELCPVVSERASSFSCKPGMLEKRQAADIGAR